MAEVAATELPGVELPAWRRCSAQRHAGSSRPGSGGQHGIYPDGRYSYQLTIYVFRYGEGTVMAIMHPDNPVAQKSVTRYMEAMKSVCVRVADSGHWGRVA